MYPNQNPKPLGQDLQLSVGPQAPTVCRRINTIPICHLHPHKMGLVLLRGGEETTTIYISFLRGRTRKQKQELTSVCVCVK